MNLYHYQEIAHLLKEYNRINSMYNNIKITINSK